MAPLDPIVSFGSAPHQISGYLSRLDQILDKTFVPDGRLKCSASFDDAATSLDEFSAEVNDYFCHLCSNVARLFAFRHRLDKNIPALNFFAFAILPKLRRLLKNTANLAHHLWGFTDPLRPEKKKTAASLEKLAAVVSRVASMHARLQMVNEGCLTGTTPEFQLGYLRKRAEFQKTLCDDEFALVERDVEPLPALADKESGSSSVAAASPPPPSPSPIFDPPTPQPNLRSATDAPPPASESAAPPVDDDYMSLP
eukprot:GHVT01082627.1.p1 GENE.GHVT01082627.1~~GHVT01082627.1.p1  ORF type:complete len:254 (-),score=53.85 GHVT01082627.1:771-1532(-)